MTISSYWDSVYDTFLASIRSVGTACTLAAMGTYMHQRGLVSADGKRMLALISQQVTFPLFLFTKIIYCNQDWSTEQCPDVTKALSDVWMLLIWPLFVVSVGLLIGKGVAYFCNTPNNHIRSVMAAVGFGNSTGLPITLLTVIHQNFPKNSDLGRVDPTLFLSVYLLLYPILQWGLGGWLLAPTNDKKNGSKPKKMEGKNISKEAAGRSPTPPNGDSYGSTVSSVESTPGSVYTTPIAGGNGGEPPQTIRALYSVSDPLRHNVLNNKNVDQYYIRHRQGLCSSDEGLYLSDGYLSSLAPPEMTVTLPNYAVSGNSNVVVTAGSPLMMTPGIVRNTSNSQGWNAAISGNMTALTDDKEGDTGSAQDDYLLYDAGTPQHSAVNLLEHVQILEAAKEELMDEENKGHSAEFQAEAAAVPHEEQPLLTTTTEPLKLPRGGNLERGVSETTTGTDVDAYDTDTICDTLKNIAERCLQPPVIGAVLGIAVATSPLRGLFVDVVHREGDASLEWLFDGLFADGQTAVPINMMILGCNLSNAYNKRMKGNKQASAVVDSSCLLPTTTMLGIVVGKMLVMPLVGIISAWVLRTFVLDVADEIAGAFYLVVMIVFLTPTANNVMVMVELSGSNAKEGIANVIALQYMVAPIILSCTMTIAIGLASTS